MFLLFLGILVVGLILIRSSSGATNLMPTHCKKQHKWVVRQLIEDDKAPYICSVCGKIAGDD